MGRPKRLDDAANSKLFLEPGEHTELFSVAMEQLVEAALYAKELEAELEKIKQSEDWNCANAMATRILELEARIEKAVAWHSDDGAGGCRVCPSGTVFQKCCTVKFLRGE